MIENINIGDKIYMHDTKKTLPQDVTVIEKNKDYIAVKTSENIIYTYPVERFLFTNVKNWGIYKSKEDYVEKMQAETSAELSDTKKKHIETYLLSLRDLIHAEDEIDYDELSKIETYLDKIYNILDDKNK